MWNSFVVSFNKYVLDERKEPKKSKYTNSIYRDELNKKPSPSKPKKSVSFASSQPLPAKEREEKDLKRSYGSIDEKKVVRVKVVMTKQEAARLLSKCKDGGVLGFKDAANELVQIPVNRVSVVSSSTSHDSGLASIPEEL